MGITEGEEREKGEEVTFEEIMAENSLNQMKDMNLRIQEAQQTSSRINSKEIHAETSITKLSKAKHNGTILREQDKSNSLHTPDP